MELLFLCILGGTHSRVNIVRRISSIGWGRRFWVGDGTVYLSYVALVCRYRARQ